MYRDNTKVVSLFLYLDSVFKYKHKLSCFAAVYP